MPAGVVSLGDVFTIPLDENRVSVAQVVGSYVGDSWFFAVFEGNFDRTGIPRLSEVVHRRVQLLALSFDARIHSGNWIVIGNQPIDLSIPLPAFREMVGTHDRVDVVDFAGIRRRRATAQEMATLPNRSIVSPMLLEKACRADVGLEPWLPQFDKFRPIEATTTRAIFGHD